MSELQRVANWNTRAGVDSEFRDLEDESIQSQLTFIEEEHNELSDAMDDNDLREVLDACGDLLVVVSGLIHRLGYSPDEVLKLINDSNYSKFVSTPEEAELTLEKYASDPRYKDVYVNEHGVVKGTVVETGSLKILKGINYREPLLESLPNVD